jgi:hypothetical protein
LAADLVEILNLRPRGAAADPLAMHKLNVEALKVGTDRTMSAISPEPSSSMITSQSACESMCLTIRAWIESGSLGETLSFDSEVYSSPIKLREVGGIEGR